MPRLEQIEATYRAALKEAASRFGDHEGMSPGRVLTWLQQFDDADLDLGCKVLKRIRYFTGTNIRTMTRQLAEMVYEDYPETPRNRIAFVPVGDPGSGSGTLARIIRNSHIGSPILSMADLPRKEPEDCEVVVFLDDFSGTGETLVEWWENVESIIRPLRAAVVVGLLVLTERARSGVEDFADTILAAEEIGDEANVFHKDSKEFTQPERDKLDNYCRQTGCRRLFLRGFHDSGLLIAFKHSCPNNSLPILWHDAKDWSSLFLRRPI